METTIKVPKKVTVVEEAEMTIQIPSWWKEEKFRFIKIVSPDLTIWVSNYGNINSDSISEHPISHVNFGALIPISEQEFTEAFERVLKKLKV